MHKLPSSPSKCRIWMKSSRVAGTPRRLPGTIYICSCHFVGGLGPTKENPHPIAFQSPAALKKHFSPKRFRPNVPDHYADQQPLETIQEEERNSFEADDPNPLQESMPSGSTGDIQSPGIASQIAYPNAHSLANLMRSLEKYNVVPVVVDQSTLEKEGEGIPPQDSTSHSCIQNVPYNPFLCIGQRLQMVMKTGSFCSDCSEKVYGKGGSFESILAQSLKSFQEDGSTQVRDQNIQCELPLLSFEMIIENKKWTDEDFKYFTGISEKSFEILYKLLYKLLGGYEVCSKLKYNMNRNTPNRVCESKHTPKGHLLITLVRLRRGYSERIMEKFFDLSKSSLSNIVTTWVRLMSIKFKALEQAMFVPVEVQEKNKPGCFKPFPNVRCVVDATEIKIQKSKNFQQQSNTYSSYKGCNTVKFLVACSVYGGLSFISEGFEGNISDRKLFLKSGILDHINAGEAVMVDRGFDIEGDLNKRDIDIIIPPFFHDRQAFTEREMYIAKAVATSRIHIETLIGRIKHFKMVRYVYPNTMLDILSDVMRVCAVLCNFNDPFVRWEDEEVEMDDM